MDGLFAPNRFRYGLQIRFRGHIVAKLIEVDLYTGAENPLVTLDSASPTLNASSPDALGFRVAGVFQDHDFPVLDFEKKAYYVEAVLSAPLILIGQPAAISIIKVTAYVNVS